MGSKKEIKVTNFSNGKGAKIDRYEKWVQATCFKHVNC